MGRFALSNIMSAIGLLFVGAGFQNAPKPADLVLRNGNIVTVDERKPQAR